MKKELNSSVIWKKEGVRNGKPLLKDTRIPVSDIIDHLALGWSVTQIEELYPSVKPEYVKELLKDISKDYKRR